MERYTTHRYDVVIIGAGGAGLRAAIEASRSGAKTAIVCKSLLGKAHTVMAEGGVAAALSNVDDRDNWRVHFRDTMKQRTTELHRVWFVSHGQLVTGMPKMQFRLLFVVVPQSCTEKLRVTQS
jgi:succinate dehydrogenase/fumarate reductase flavoprotein subunit